MATKSKTGRRSQRTTARNTRKPSKKSGARYKSASRTR